MDHQGGDPVDAAMRWQERADDSRSALDADVDDAARRLEMVGRGPASPDKSARPRDAPGSANRRPRKAGGERPDGRVPLTQDATDEVPAPAPAPLPPWASGGRYGAPPPAVGTPVRAKDDAAVRGVVSLHGRKRPLDVRTTNGTIIAFRKAQLLPTSLTDEEAALCSRPLTPVEYLQAQIDGAVRVEYVGRSFGNRFQATDGAPLLQLVALADGGVRCALCDWRWETSGAIETCADRQALFKILRRHSGTVSDDLNSPATCAHLARLLAAAGVEAPASASSDDNDDAPPAPPLLGRPGASSMSTATAELAPGDAALDLLKNEFRRGEDEGEWELDEDNWSDRLGVEIQPSTTWRTAIRGVDVALASAFAPAKPCDPRVTPPVLMRLEEGRRLRSAEGHEKLFVLATQLFGEGLNAFLGKLPPPKLRSSSFSSPEEDEASAEDEETPRRFLIGGEDGGLVVTNAAPWYLEAASARKPKPDDAMILRETGSPAGLYSAVQAPERSSVEVLLPDARRSAYCALAREGQASKHEAEARKQTHAYAARYGDLNLAVFNQPCPQGCACKNKNRSDPTERCRYNHQHTDDKPSFYTFDCATGEWSDTDFKKALDSGVMRDSVTGERVTVVPGGHAHYNITFANGNTASRYIKQLRVHREGENPPAAVPLTLYNQPCPHGSACTTKNRPDPTERCRYIHEQTDDKPSFYTFDCATGEWSDTDFKKALDSGVMRDSVTGERVSVVPGTRPGNRWTITLANGNTASRYIKQLRVPGEDG